MKDLIFGLQWLRKAILRQGNKALRDEETLYAQESAEARAAGTAIRVGMDWYPVRWRSSACFWKGWKWRFLC